MDDEAQMDFVMDLFIKYRVAGKMELRFVLFNGS